MENQFNPSICLKQLLVSIKAQMLQGRLYSQLLKKFPKQEIMAQVQRQRQSFGQEFDNEIKDQVRTFMEGFCQNFVQSQKNDVENMRALEQEVKRFQEKYQLSQKNIKEKITYKCDECDAIYNTKNGLHNHRRKKNSCTRERQQTSLESQAKSLRSQKARKGKRSRKQAGNSDDQFKMI